MPHIQIRDINGQLYQIDSGDRDTITRWLGEIIGLIGPGARNYHIPLQIQIYPFFDEDGKADWCADSRVICNRYTLDRGGIQTLLDDLRKAGIDVPETTGATA